MENQMELSIEEFENDLFYEKNRINLSTNYYIKENLHKFDEYKEDVSPNDESFSLVFRYNFNCNSKENREIEENVSDNSLYIKTVNSVDKNVKCLPFTVTKDMPIPDICSENQIIITIRTSINIPRELKESILKKCIECIEYQRIKEVLESNPNKRSKVGVMKIKMKLKLNLGRKKKDDYTVRNHNAYSPDNLNNKIKNWINNSLITTIKGIIDSLYSKEEKIQFLSDLNLPQDRKVHVSKDIIKKINYDFRANRTNKNDNLALFKLTIYEYLSTNISSKNKGLPENFNKIIMDKLLEDAVNKDIFNFIFNQLTLGDFLEIIAYKKELEDFSEFIKLEENQRKLLKKILKENLFGVDKILVKIYENGITDMKYINCFSLLFFNLIRYIMNKEGRIRKETKKEDEDEE